MSTKIQIISRIDLMSCLLSAFLSILLEGFPTLLLYPWRSNLKYVRHYVAVEFVMCEESIYAKSYKQVIFPI